MIVAELTGGIGNQLFQYAAARSLAHKNNVQLKLSINRLKYNWYYNYCLQPFNIEENFISAGKEKKLLKANQISLLKEIVGGFNKNFFEQKDNLYLKGYWQSEKYFKDIGPLIRKEFTFKSKPSGKNEDVAGLIQNSESIAIHVRRGDYVTIDTAVKKYGGICDLDYYQKCVDYLSAKVKNPVVFIFSNDPKWVKENLKLNAEAVYVTHNSTRKHFKFENNYLFRNSLILFKNFIVDKSYEDFRLMSLCKHFIIANSSFSWWGAWLGNHPGKIVCAPSRWINAIPDKIKIADAEYKDLIPESWIKI
jgi:hypothetical protein